MQERAAAVEFEKQILADKFEQFTLDVHYFIETIDAIVDAGHPVSPDRLASYNRQIDRLRSARSPDQEDSDATGIRGGG